VAVAQVLVPWDQSGEEAEVTFFEQDWVSWMKKA
jgi:hypothetical protein